MIIFVPLLLPCSENRVTCCFGTYASPAPSPLSIRHSRLLSLSDCVACVFKTRLRQLRPGRAFCLSTVSPPSCGLSSISTTGTSLRPCHGRPCNSALAASTTTCRLRGGCHGVSGATWSRATIPEPAGSSPTCPVVADFGQHRHTNCSCHGATIPANNCRPTYISSRGITRLELIAIRHPSTFSVCLTSTSQNISFSPVFS